MSSSKKNSTENSGLGSAAKSLVILNAHVAKELTVIGTKSGIKAAVRITGVGAKSGDRDRTVVERTINGTATTGVVGSVAYGVITGDFTGAAIGVGASVGVRGRKKIKSAAKSVWNFAKEVFNDLSSPAEEPEAGGQDTEAVVEVD